MTARPPKNETISPLRSSPGTLVRCPNRSIWTQGPRINWRSRCQCRPLKETRSGPEVDMNAVAGALPR